MNTWWHRSDLYVPSFDDKSENNFVLSERLEPKEQWFQCRKLRSSQLPDQTIIIPIVDKLTNLATVHFEKSEKTLHKTELLNKRNKLERKKIAKQQQKAYQEKSDEEKKVGRENRKRKQENNGAKRLAKCQKQDATNQAKTLEFLKDPVDKEAYLQLKTEKERKAFVQQRKKWFGFMQHLETLPLDQATKTRIKEVATDPDAVRKIVAAWKRKQPKQSQQVPKKKQKTEKKPKEKNKTDLYVNEERMVEEAIEVLETAKLSTPPLCTLRIPLKPNTHQKACLRQLMGAYRHTYNVGVDIFEKPEEYTEEFRTLSPAIEDISKQVLHDTSLCPSWVLDVPANQRQMAIMGELKTAHEALLIKRRSDPEAELHFKSVKDDVQTIPLGQRSLHFFDNDFAVWPRWKQWSKEEKHISMKLSECSRARLFDFGLLQEEAGEKSGIPPRHDCKLTYIRSKRRYYLLIPCDVPPKWKKKLQPEKIISLDPGVRTFLTGYSPTGHVIEFAPQSVQRLCRLAHHSDCLRSRIDVIKETEYPKPLSQMHLKKIQRAKNMRRALLRLNLRIKNLVEDMHWKIAHFLCAHYDVILLPKFEVSQMVKKKENKPEEEKEKQAWRRKISKDTVRRMELLSHYKFKQKLMHKAKQHGCVLLIVNEAYTSKTCTNCGKLNEQLKGKKVFNCPFCKRRFDRDAAAARNILLKNLFAPPKSTEVLFAGIAGQAD